MNRKVKRFGELERLAEGEEREAARRLKECIDSVLAQRGKLDQLRAYLAEYRISNDPGANPQRIEPARWENYHRFLTKLSETIEAQERELAKAESQYEVEAARWQTSHAKTEAMSRLLAKYETEYRREIDTREQKEADDRPRQPAER